MAVLANAVDANKQVLYVRDSKGTVLARQLIAINRKQELLHYFLYLASEEATGKNPWIPYHKKIDQFVKQIAERVGLKLGNSGAPESLANNFWYDDESQPWENEEPEPAVFHEQYVISPWSVFSAFEVFDGGRLLPDMDFPMAPIMVG